MTACSFRLENASGFQHILGIDEVGRGCLAGPVVVAGVIFDSEMWRSAPAWMSDVTDSKLLSEKKRKELSVEIKRSARAWSLQSVDHQTIDEINILQAMFRGARAVVEDLIKRGEKIQLALVDGNQQIPRLFCPQRTVIQGDSVSRSIAAASILAKVERDLWMKEAANRYPQYGFERNVGYATKLHREALKEFGPCEIHRRTFLSKILNQPNLFQRGLSKEKLVSEKLEKDGYQIRFQNWRKSRLEIDLIAEKNGELHFFEVRSREREVKDLNQLFPHEKRMNFVKAIHEFRSAAPSLRSLKSRIHFVEVVKDEAQFYWDAFSL